MLNVKEVNDDQVNLKEHSEEYRLIRKEAESKWPEWKKSTYNVNFATSAHAIKLNI